MNIRMMFAPRAAAAICAFSLFISGNRVAGDNRYRLPGHVMSRAIHQARFLGSRDAGDAMRISLVLKPRNQAALDDFLKRLQDPRDPAYRRFLTPAEFNARFGPSESDVRLVSEHLARYGMRVGRLGSLVLTAEGPTASVESSFQVQVGNYQTRSGRVAHAANADPIFPADLAGKIKAVAGLDDFMQLRPRARERALDSRASMSDGMTPAKIRSAYSLDTIPQTGAGETLAIFTLAGYTASDIAAYASATGITAPTLQNVLVDGGPANPSDGAEETTLDIQLAAAVAPGLSKIMVYQGPNTDTGVLHTYAQIANDNVAKVVSSSWGLSEDLSSSSFRDAENTIFQQMAAQGQSIFAASGDDGATDDQTRPNNLSVDDPASQPYVTAVGGTTLSLTSANTYRSESAWAGSGGGTSDYWAQPSWQSQVGTNNHGQWTNGRMLPDVSLNADPNTGYSIYFGGGWHVYGGTSCAAPIWAAFTSLVNQKRVADGRSRVGFLNPQLYQIGQSAQNPAAFHDVASGNNGYFLGADFHDLATGWGSFSGQGLFNNLTAPALPAAIAPPGQPASIEVKSAI